MMLEVREPGFYVIATLWGSYVVEELFPHRDYSHMATKIIDGPFGELRSADGRYVVSGMRIANQKLAEYLSALASGPLGPQEKAEALAHDLQEIRDAFSGDPQKVEKLLKEN